MKKKLFLAHFGIDISQKLNSFKFLCVLIFVLGITLNSLATGIVPVQVKSASKVNVTTNELQQRLTVSGTVKDDNGIPIPGVNILEKGTTNGTITGLGGKYSIEVSGSESVLSFTCIGYQSQEIIVGSQSEISLTMKFDLQKLDEIVVVGYGTVKKSDLTGSLSSVSSEDIEEMPVTNLNEVIQGRAAGVDVTTTNFRPGEGSEIRIRGNRSLLASNEPLYVVDGIPLARGSNVIDIDDDMLLGSIISDLNPSDIESIEVLKDASASAIYGSRGANGVILITTKRGKKGQSSVTYEGSVGFESPLVQVDLFDGAGYAELKRDAYRAEDAYSTDYPNPEDDFTLFGLDPYTWEGIAQAYEWIDKENRIPRMENGIPVYDPSKVRTYDWRDQVLQTGINQNHQLSFLKGTENSSTLFSIGYKNHQGIVKGQGYERLNIRLNVDYEITDWLKIGASNNYSISIQDYGADLYGKASGMLPISVPYDENDNFIRNPGGDDLIKNPLLDDELITDERRSNRFLSSIYAEMQLADGLKFRSNFGPDYKHHRRGVYQAAASSERDGSTSYGRNNQSELFTWVWENLLYYNKQVGIHDFGVTVMQSISADRYESTNIVATNLPYDSQKWYALQTTYEGTAEKAESSFKHSQMASFMGRINYALMDKYLLTLTGRWDGNSILADDNKWAFFPSAALAWKIHEEDFLTDLSAISNLKLRLGYGSTGNSAIEPYTTNGRLESTPYNWSGTTAAKGFAPELIPNPLLSWERTNQSNLGLDLGLFSNRVYMSVELYRANTESLLMDRALPTVTGYPNIKDNIGKTRNSGIEITLNTVNVTASGNEFRWETDLTFAKNKEEIVELYGEKLDDIGNRWFIGEPVNVYYDYKFDGIWQLGEEAQMEVYNTNGSNFGAGEIRVVDIDKNDTINVDDKTILGSSVPDWTAGLNNRFYYKGFEFSFFIFARIGQGIYNRALVPTLAGRYPDREVNYWTPDNPSNEYPRPNYRQEFPVYAEALYYQKTSFVKVRNIKLSYNLSRTLLDKARISSMNIYVMALNPLLFTDFKLHDPEVIGDPRNAKSDIYGLSTKSFVVGVKIGL